MPPVTTLHAHLSNGSAFVVVEGWALEAEASASAALRYLFCVGTRDSAKALRYALRHPRENMTFWPTTPGRRPPQHPHRLPRHHPEAPEWATPAGGPGHGRPGPAGVDAEWLPGGCRLAGGGRRQSGAARPGLGPCPDPGTPGAPAPYRMGHGGAGAPRGGPPECRGGHSRPGARPVATRRPHVGRQGTRSDG